jgi:hypothetical protein
MATLHIRTQRWLLVDENEKITRDLFLRTPGNISNRSNKALIY